MNSTLPPPSASAQDRRHPLADRGVVAVARQVDQAGQVAAVGVAAHEEPQLAALAGEHHRLGDRDQLLDRGEEQLVAGVVLQHVEQLLAGVAARLDAAALEHLVDLLACSTRDAQHRLGVGRRGEQAEEPALPHHLAVVVERLDADVVEVGPPVHGRLGVRLGQHEQPGLLARRSRTASGSFWNAEDCSWSPRRMPSPVPGHRAERELVAVLDRGCTRGSRGTRSGRRPASAGSRCRGATSVGSGSGGGSASSSSTISASLACIRGQSSTASRMSREHPLQPRLDGGELRLVGDAVDLDVHPRLLHRLRPPWSTWPVLSWSLVSALRPSSPPRTLRSSPATSRTTSKSGWMTTWTVRPSSASAIVVESTRNGMSSVTTSTTVCEAGRPAVLGTVGVKTRTRAVPCGRLCGELEVAGQRAVQVDLAAVDDVLGRDVAEVRRQQPAPRTPRGGPPVPVSGRRGRTPSPAGRPCCPRAWRSQPN